MKNKILIICTIFLAVIGLGIVYVYKINPRVLTADSGWDNDYGGGGSDWSSSDWGGSSSSSSSSSGGGSIVDGFISLVVIIFFVGLVIVLTLVFDNGKTTSTNKVINTYNPRIEELIKKYFPEYQNSSVLAMKLYKKFVEIQAAWMNFDYDKLKELCSEELYTSYKSDLEVLKLKNGQNIMHSFNMTGYNIDDIREENNVIIVKMKLSASFYDYVIDTTTKAITRGNKSTKMNPNYELEYTIYKEYKKVQPKFCPNCGAKLEGNECKYCNSHVSNNNNKFVLSKKRRI